MLWSKGMRADEVVLRLPAAGDVQGLARVHVEGWRAAYRGLLPDSLLDRLSVERRTEQWGGFLAETDEGDVVVADADGDVVGFAWVGPARDDDADASTGELLAIYLLAEHWDAGIGKALHDAGVERLRARGFARATLWVLDGNERAQAFYERQGWRPDGEAKVEHADGFELRELRYARPL